MTSLLPPLFGAGLPAPAVPGLSEDEQAVVNGLSVKMSMQAAYGMVHNSYYEGTQRLRDLGVAIPPQLAGVRTVVDWPRIAVDTLVQRCTVDGFRLPGATDVDDELAEHWQANDMDAEQTLCWLDSLVYGRGYMIVGSPDTPGDSPLVTVESPLNLSMSWDPRTRRAMAAFQSYEVEGIYRAVLYLPDVTVSMSRSAESSSWAIDDRDEHNFGEVPVVRFPNRARSVNREGRSEISPAIMNTTDSACRSLLGMEIAREFYSVPHRYILGASESDFQDAQGNPKSAIQMVLSKMLAFERDEEGHVPTVGQFTAYDPSVYTKIIDEHAQLMASYTQFPPAYFGQTTTANPASADAIRVAESGVDRRATQVQRQFSTPLEQVQRLVWRFANGGAQVPPEFNRLATDWVDAATPTPTGTSEAIFKQVQMGAVPPTSDVILKRLGYSNAERDALSIDRQVDAGASILAELANSLQAKEARVDKSIANDILPSGKQAAAGSNRSTSNPPPSNPPAPNLPATPPVPPPSSAPPAGK
jgi:hypothetical protein